MSERAAYDNESIRALFDEMSETYGLVNLITSFGFSARWRDQAIAALAALSAPSELRRVADLMTGAGELWRSIARRLPAATDVVGVDLSRGMLSRARRSWPFASSLLLEDALHPSLEPGSFDAVVSSFGVKTLNHGQQAALAEQVARLLRPGGAYSFIEISVPPSRPLRWLYMFYLKRVIPLVGWALLGNPANYTMLGIYTEAFDNCRHFATCLTSVGLEAEYVSYFFGCATGVCGRRPASAR
jgi:demethylmenaquinone methyltransferase/2-methoxy-6-polyprenyl-1,4-benzoquinol methylase